MLTDSTAAVGDVAGAAGFHLHELTLVRSSLEEAFMSLTADSVEFHAGPSPLTATRIHTHIDRHDTVGDAA